VGSTSPAEIAPEKTLEEEVKDIIVKNKFDGVSLDI